MAGAGRRILTVPNVITLVRLSCLPVFLWLLFVQEDRAAAAWLLAALGATDWMDGYVARRFGQVSEFGKVLDPTADRLLFLVSVLAIAVDGAVPWWFALAVVVREAALGIALVALTLAGMERFDVSWWGKAGTAAQMVAFPLLLLGSSGDGTWEHLCRLAGWAVGLPALVLSYWSAIAYVPVMRRSLAAGRARRRMEGAVP